MAHDPDLKNGDQKAAIYRGFITNRKRREQDSNLRVSFADYTLSRCAPSPDKTLNYKHLQKYHS